eukprot:UN1534
MKAMDTAQRCAMRDLHPWTNLSPFERSRTTINGMLFTDTMTSSRAMSNMYLSAMPSECSSQRRHQLLIERSMHNWPHAWKSCHHTPLTDAKWL